MKQVHHARKQRQLRYRVKRLAALLKNGQNGAQQEVASLISKIKSLTKALSGALATFQLQKILGPAVLALGMTMGTQADAQSFKPPVVNPFGLLGTDTEVALPAFGDLDGDGDVDILVGEYSSMGQGTWRYQKNIGNPFAPQFDAVQINPFGLTSLDVTYPTLVDIDGDGDLDLFATEQYGLSFFKNAGTPTAPQFNPPVFNPFGLSTLNDPAFPAFADIDSDGDMDIVSFNPYGVLFFENTGTATNPQFAAPTQNPFGLVNTDYTFFPVFADLDNDGDQDLLVGEYYGKMQYYKNSGTAGSPQFEAPVLNPFGLISTYYYAIPTVADLDNDGDLDLLVGEYYGKMQYFENTGVSSTHAPDPGIQLELLPNPAHELLSIRTDARFERIEAYDVLGRLQGAYDGSVAAIDVGQWNSGTYLLKFFDGKGGSVTKKVQKQ